MKTKPVEVAAMITVQDIKGWYEDNPMPPSKAEAVFPLRQSENKTWKTVSNLASLANEAADPISMNSKVPVSGRDGYKHVIGEMASFGKGREMEADEIEKFEELKRKFLLLKDATIAKQLLDYYGDDLAFVRTAMRSEMAYLDWALVSNACNLGFVAANSPYMQGLTAMDYGVTAWQKNNNITSWANAASEILTDIQSVLDTGKLYGKYYNTIFINKKWFTYVRQNTQIQKYCATLVANLFTTQSPPTLEAVNTMLGQYFDMPVRFEVVDEIVTRAKADGTKTSENPFQDGVAVFAQSSILGHFEWNGIPITDASRETYESFFLVGNYKQIDPSYSKTYAKGRGFPVVDTYAENFYLKVNAVAW